jgi:hypothetical protein
VFEQLAPIELNVTTTLKGNWEPGRKVTVLVAGAPGSKPYGNHWDFPKVDDTILWFLGPETDYRRGTGKEPLLTPNSAGIYKPLENGNWADTADKNEVIDITQLKQTILSPSPVTTPIPANPVPARVQPGQTFNLVQFYDLNKSEQIILKGGPKPGSLTDKSTIQSVLAALDKPQIVSSDTSLPGSEEKDKHMALIFVKSDNATIGFDFNFKDNYLIGHSPDTFRIPISLELRQALGLN